MLVTSCPSAHELEQFLLGRLAGPRALFIEQHIDECTCCSEVMQQLKVKDPLLRALAAPAALEAPRADYLVPLIDRLCRIPNEAAAETPTPGSSVLPLAGPAQKTDRLDFLAPPRGPGELGWLGDYRVLRVLGKGGMGIVFEAEEAQLKRKVALKVMRDQVARRDDAHERFLREARAMAAVKHDHIATVYQAGRVSDVPFLAMEFLRGESLDAWLKRGQPLTPFQVVRMGAEMAKGLAAAHDRGVIHRDIKPANIWLEAPGGRVKLLDFGLAKPCETESPLTGQGELLGTPGYMAPEQLRGEAVDGRCDLFSLGCVLYQLCTGELAFPGGSAVALIGAVLHREPPAPREVKAEVPAALSALVMQLLEKDAARRPESAKEVVERLQAIWKELKAEAAKKVEPGAAENESEASEEKEAAPTPAPASEKRKPPPRRWAAVAASWMASAALLGGVIVIIIKTDGCTPPSTPSAASMPVMSSPFDALRRDAISREVLPADAPPELVAIMGTGYLQSWNGGIDSVAFSPDGKLLASCKGFTVEVWDATSGRKMGTLTGHKHNTVRVTFSADGKYLASGGFDHKAKIWDAETFKEVRTLPETDFVSSLAFHPESKLIAVGSGSKTVKVWDVTTGKVVKTLKGHTQVVQGVAFSPDGTRLLSGSCEGNPHYLGKAGEVKVWDVETEVEVLNLEEGDHSGWCVAFSPDGNRLVSGSEDDSIRIWDASNGKLSRTLKKAGGVRAVGFNRDGRRLVSSGDDRRARVWDPATGKELLVLPEHNDCVSCVAVSPDDQMIATADSSGPVRLWNATTGEQRYPSPGNDGTIHEVALTPDGRLLASACADRNLLLWHITGPKPARGALLRGHPNLVRSVAFSPDGKRLISGSYDRTARIWDAASGKPLFPLEGHAAVVTSVAFSSDGQQVATGSDDKTVKVWDAATGKELYACSGHTARVERVAFSADGKWLASASSDRTVRLWDTRTGQEIRVLKGHGEFVTCVCFSPDSELIATSSGDQNIKAWKTTTGQEVMTLKGHTEAVVSVAFSPAGTLLASTSHDGTVRLWDAKDGRLLKTIVLCPPNGGAVNVIFSPDGRHLITGNANGTIYVLRLVDGPK